MVIRQIHSLRATCSMWRSRSRYSLFLVMAGMCYLNWWWFIVIWIHMQELSLCVSKSWIHHPRGTDQIVDIHAIHLYKKIFFVETWCIEWNEYEKPRALIFVNKFLVGLCVFWEKCFWAVSWQAITVENHPSTAINHKTFAHQLLQTTTDHFW